MRKILSHALFISLLMASLVVLFLALALPLLADAQVKYEPLVGIPTGGGGTATTLGSFIQGLVNLSMAVGAILAVLMLVIGGFEWMVSEAIEKKEAGRETVKNAILGLLILLASVLILRTINPQLVNLKILSGVPSVSAPVKPSSGTTSGPQRGDTRPEVIDVRGEEAPSDYVCANLSDGSLQCFRPDTATAKALIRERERDDTIETPNKPLALVFCESSQAVFCDSCIKRLGQPDDQCSVVSLKFRFYKTKEECEAGAGLLQRMSTQKATQSSCEYRVTAI